MKKLNNRGWGLQVMLVCVLILMIALVVVAVLIQQTFGEILGTTNNTVNNTTNTTNTDKNNTTNTNKEEEKVEIKLTYSDLEKKVVSAAKTYQKENYDDILDGEQISVTVKTLKRLNLLEDIKDIDDSNTSCTGYALFKRKNDEITYQAYIKCNDYTTNGYMDYLDI